MASAGRGLGRGLLALVDPDATGPGLVELSVDRIAANSRQPRTAFDDRAAGRAWPARSPPTASSSPWWCAIAATAPTS